MRRTFAASFLATLLVATPALAADTDAKTPTLDTTAAVAAATSAPDAPAAPDFSLRFEARLHRPSALPALYVASAGLQGYDAYSTLTALKHGGVEANPFMKSVVKHPAAFVALKASVATTSIMAAERMWKNGNRLGAVMAAVAAGDSHSLALARDGRLFSWGNNTAGQRPASIVSGSTGELDTCCHRDEPLDRCRSNACALARRGCFKPATSEQPGHRCWVAADACRCVS